MSVAWRGSWPLVRAFRIRAPRGGPVRKGSAYRAEGRALLRLGIGTVLLPAAGCHFEKTKPGKGDLRPFPGFVIFRAAWFYRFAALVRRPGLYALQTATA